MASKGVFHFKVLRCLAKLRRLAVARGAAGEVFHPQNRWSWISDFRLFLGYDHARVPQRHGCKMAMTDNQTSENQMNEGQN